MFFQQSHSLNKDEFTLMRLRCFDYPTHIHGSFELYVQLDGQSTVVIDDKSYYLSARQAVLVFPYQSHSYSYKPGERGNCCMAIFSPFLVPNFGRFDMVPTDNRCDVYIPEDVDISNAFLRQSLAYYICGSFEKDRKYQGRYHHALSEGLMSVVMYATENFKGDCTLRQAVNLVGYDYAYISKIFKKTIGMTFNQYVNFMRIQHSQVLLKTTNTGVTQIALECGYNSLRSFNRKFVEQVGVTPQQYRKT